MWTGGPNPGGSSASRSEKTPSVSSQLALTVIPNVPRSIDLPSPGASTNASLAPAMVIPFRVRGSVDHATSEGDAALALFGRLNDRQRVPARVTKPEHWRYGIPPARDLRIDVDTSGLESRMVGIYVGGREDDAGVDGCRAALHRRGERDRCRASGGDDLDPPHLSVCELHMAPHLEPKGADVELERAILIASRDGHATDLGDVQLAGHCRLLSDSSDCHSSDCRRRRKSSAATLSQWEARTSRTESMHRGSGLVR